MQLKTKVLFKKLHPDAQLPKQAHKTDAGFDLHSVEDVLLFPRKITETGFGDGFVVISCGLAISLEEGWEINLNNVEIIKRGILSFTSVEKNKNEENFKEIYVSILNLSMDVFPIKKGERVGKVCLYQNPIIEFEEAKKQK